MALVLRKAFLPKNASILKCIKGRPLATAPNKKHTAALLHNEMKRSLGKKSQRFNLTTYSKLRDIQHNSQASALRQPYKSPSSPCLALSTTSNGPSADCFQRSYSDHLFHKVAPSMLQMLVKSQRRTFTTECSDTDKGQASPGLFQGLEAVCACPCPCPGSCCLPPPCNTPPKCIQYMTGYYYYPYGTWFCGPYHVATGPCGPCTGPVVPGGPCGPCGPCPGGPCGPPGLSCACICGVGSHNHMAPNMSSSFSPNAQFVPFGMQGMYHNPHAFDNSIQYSYDPHPSFSPYPPGSLPWGQLSMAAPNMPGPHLPNPNMPNPNMPSPIMPSPFFGPGINVPITPIPVTTEPCGPVVPTPNPSTPSSPRPKSSVRINPAYMREARSGASPYGSKPPPMPTRPPTRTSSNSSVYFSKTHTSARPISTSGDACSSNLTPKPLRHSPPSRYDTICALSRNNPFAKPRMNSRMLSRPDMIQTCYYSTKHVASAEIKSLRKLHKKHRQVKVSSIKLSQAERVVEANRKRLCYWCLLCDKSSCPCQHCGQSTVAQKRLPMTGITSKSSQITTEPHDGEQFEKKPLQCDWI